MCELFAMNFNKEVMPSFTFKGFIRRGYQNPDGWGIARYHSRKAVITREPISAEESIVARRIGEDSIDRSAIHIAHVRLASVGKNTIRNTHPFRQKLRGRDYVFAHNGTIGNHAMLSTGAYTPAGETDSEHVFCYIMNEIEKNIHESWDSWSFRWLHLKLRELNELGRLNCIMSDGEHVFCYHDREGYNGLHFAERKAPFDRVSLLDDDWEIDMAGEKKTGIRGYLAASKPLTDEKWEPFGMGELKVFSRGELLFSSDRGVTGGVS